ncbi:MAG: c-type cytochrome [Giesbergeria sp.]
MEPNPRENETHLAQERENSEPEERMRPMPLVAGVVVLVMVLFGVVYLLMSDPVGDARLGDRRTVADLSGPVPAAPGAAVDGKALFAAHCAACHQATGKGLPGVFPPLDGSEWVHGEPRVLANILLHGIEGEIEVEGATYKGSMPSFQQLADSELAGLASYIRSSWSNKGEAVKPDLFEHERKASQRTKPFEGGAALKALAAGS